MAVGLRHSCTLCRSQGCATGKMVYCSTWHAVRNLRVVQTRRKRQGQRYRERNYYACPVCGYYHLTGQARSNVSKISKIRRVKTRP